MTIVFRRPASQLQYVGRWKKVEPHIRSSAQYQRFPVLGIRQGFQFVYCAAPGHPELRAGHRHRGLRHTPHIAAAYRYSTGYHQRKDLRGEWQTCGSPRTLPIGWLQNMPMRRSMGHDECRHFDYSPQLPEQHPKSQLVRFPPEYLVLRSTG